MRRSVIARSAAQRRLRAPLTVAAALLFIAGPPLVAATLPVAAPQLVAFLLPEAALPPAAAPRAGAAQQPVAAQPAVAASLPVLAQSPTAALMPAGGSAAWSWSAPALADDPQSQRQMRSPTILGSAGQDEVWLYRSKVADVALPLVAAIIPRAVAGNPAVVTKPAAPKKPPVKTTPPPPTPPNPSPSGSRPWASVEAYYLKLVNCTRTGGWVQSNGSCSGYGSGRYSSYRPPLRFDYTLARRASRPYAELVAEHNICDHNYGTDFGQRMRNAGYRSYAGENLGCRSGDPYKAVLASHRYFQSEKSYNGGHWRNMKDPRWKVVGIGIWVSHGRVRLVTDFYGS